MKPVLLLLPREDGRPARERRPLEVRRVDDAGGGAARTGDYASVIVLNDGGAGTLRRLRLALALHERHRHVQIGLLTYLDGRLPAGADPLLAAIGPLPVLAELGPELKVELKDEVLSLEYQAV